jgi:DNA polymerase/3'-5' exonuclease PolX
MSPISDMLIQIPGIGVKTAWRYKQLIPSSRWNAIKTPRQLRSALIRLPQSKFEQLPIAAQTDLLFQPIHRIPRVLIDVVNKEFGIHREHSIHFDIAGSYRRGKSQSGDLDIVISSDGWKPFMSSINSGSRKIKIMQPFAGLEDKITVLIRICINKSLRDAVFDLLEPYHNKARIIREGSVYIKADIFLTHPDEYIFALLFATGSGKFNIRMRRLAKLRGYLLNQRGLYKKSHSSTGKEILKRVPITNEREVFDILGMRWLEPKDRIQ